MTTEKSTKKRYTVAQSKDAFIKHHRTVAAYSERVADLIEKKLTMAPMVHIIGDGEQFEPSEIIVNYDGIRYEYFSLAKAIDICVRIYFVLNISYPPACELVWTFIEKYFYGDQLKEATKKPRASSAMSKLMEKLHGMVLFIYYNL